MSRNYIDYVICESDNCRIICYAPAFSHFEDGAEVIVETPYSEERATVVASTTVEKGSELDNFIHKAFGDRKIYRVLTKVKYYKIEYKEDEDEADRD